MTVFRTTWMLLLLAMGAGCVTRGNPEVLESRLRQYEDALAETQDRLESTDRELQVARRETLSLREQLAQENRGSLLPEQADVLYRVAGVKLNPLLSGGLDNDGQSGDDLVVAMIVPHDQDGELLKLPGEVHLRLFDGSIADESRSLGTWKFTAEQCREHWHSGFAGSGFLFQIPWQRVPTERVLALQVELVTPDGRRYQNQQVVHIDLPTATPDNSLAASAETTETTAQAESKPTAPQPITPVNFQPIPDDQPAANVESSTDDK